MLKLTIKNGRKAAIDTGSAIVEVIVLRSDDRGAEIGFIAPRSIQIDRAEVRRRKQHNIVEVACVNE